ncbi:ribonuclease 3-like [Phragmites australis]|uniref:ribonuclease 3-like n=1 Tax=Phragmites australis TaxID=29695 RepID=UPI002D7995EA|nr:ribonuclease 3-like [Phragmites australis]
MARRTILLSLILGLLAAANAVPFDFYYLILMWPGAYCEDSDNGCCVPKYGYPSEDFFVRSFITFDLSINKAVVRCKNGSPFDYNKLDKIENNLNHYWSNIKCPATDGVNTWKSAWNSYGVCSGLKQLDYFNAALQLRKQADVLSALSDQGIKPDYKLYSTEKIKWAVSQKLGVTPGVQCRDGPFGKKQLNEIYLCVDTDAKTFIECPKLPPGLQCPAEVVFHPYFSWMLNTTSAFDANILLPTETI